MAKVTPIEKEKREVSVDPGRFSLAEHTRTEYVYNAAHGTEREDLFDPAFWAHVAAKLRPYDHVEVRIDDGSWIAELIVIGCDRNWARMHEFKFHKLTEDAGAPESSIDHIVEWGGPHHKWRVIRKSDRETLKAEMTKDEANKWLKNYESALKE